MQENNMVYIAVDGDNAGRMVGRAVLANDEAALADVSARIDQGQVVAQMWLEGCGGQKISGGGDEMNAKIPASAIADLEQLRSDYQFATQLTLTVGVGSSLSEAGKSLMAGKFRGKDQIVQYDPSVDQELAQAQGHAADGTGTDEENKISEAYLGKSQAMPISKAHYTSPLLKSTGVHGEPKGDHVIGTTQSGKPVHYESEDHSLNLNYSPQDHTDAADLHLKQRDHHRDEAKKIKWPEHGSPEHAKKSMHEVMLIQHDRASFQHKFPDSDLRMGKSEDLYCQDEDCQYCLEAEQDHDHTDDCQYCAAAEAPEHDHTDDCEYCAATNAEPDHEHGDDCQYCQEADSKLDSHEHTDDCQYCADAPAQDATQQLTGEMTQQTGNENSGDIAAIDDTDMPVGSEMDGNISRPEGYADGGVDQGADVDDEFESEPNLHEVLKTGLDNHADSIKREKVVNMIAEALEGFKANRQILEKAKEQAPALYQSTIMMLKAMIEMGKMLGLQSSPEEQEQPQAPQAHVPTQQSQAAPQEGAAESPQQ